MSNTSDGTLDPSENYAPNSPTEQAIEDKLDKVLGDFVNALPIKATEIGWEKVGEDLEDAKTKLLALLKEAKIEERAKTTEVITSLIYKSPSAEIEGGQYNEHGQCEVPGYISIDTDAFQKIMEDVNSENKVDYIGVTLEQWEKYISPHIEELQLEREDTV